MERDKPAQLDQPGHTCISSISLAVPVISSKQLKITHIYIEASELDDRSTENVESM